MISSNPARRGYDFFPLSYVFSKDLLDIFIAGINIYRTQNVLVPRKINVFFPFYIILLFKFLLGTFFFPEHLSVFFFSCQRCMRWIRVVMSLSYQLTFQTLSECSIFYSVVMSLNLAEKINVTFFPFQIFFYFVSWEPEGRWRFRKMFRWEPEGCYCCTKSMVIAPFWFSTEHR